MNSDEALHGPLDVPEGLSGHLAYYKTHGISPVRYDIEDLQAHFDRRDSLYRGLGLPPVAFKGCDVLEVAPGSGHNSLYVAAARPAVYELVEPNPTAVRDIESLFASFDKPHTAPVLHPLRLEEFDAERRYDIVLCENWLSALPHERVLMRKLTGLVKPDGVLVVTITPLTGLVPNIIRKLLALRLVDRDLPFAQQAATLTNVFGKHLQTIQNMTRSHRDWVVDCLLNPHYLNIVLSLDVMLDDIGPSMEILSAVPRFITDWRWFKSLVRGERDFNNVFRSNYQRNIHNFIDYRRQFPPRTADDNLTLESLSSELHAAALSWQDFYDSTGSSDPESAEAIGRTLGRLGDAFGAIDAELRLALDEAGEVWNKEPIDARHVEEMQHFAGLFGRETIYISSVARRSRA